MSCDCLMSVSFIAPAPVRLITSSLHRAPVEEKFCRLLRDGNFAVGSDPKRDPCVYGRAFGEKKPIGRSRAVRRPPGASRIPGIECPPPYALALSPRDPPGITR